MTETKIKITAEDNASRVIDNVTKKLGIFNKEGIAIGIGFAVMNQAIQLAREGVQRLGQEFMKGLQRAIDFEYNLALVVNTIKNMDMSIGEMSNELHKMSMMFGVDVNNLVVNLKSLTKEGYGPGESLRMLGQAEFYAKAKGDDLASTIEAVNRAMGIFKLSSSDSGYILERYNELTTLTNLSIQDIADILGRASLKIQEYGYNLNDVVNIMYTLSKGQIGPRAFSPAFISFLEGEGYKKVEVMPADTVKDLDAQMKNIEKTHKSAIDTIGAAWDGFWERVGQGALIVADNLTAKWKYSFSEGMTKVLNDTSLTIGNTALSTETWYEALVRIEKEINNLDAAIKKDTKTVSDYYDELQGAQYAYQYAQDMRAATLEVQAQEDAIEKLRRVANRYSLEQQSNQLAIMKIQYGAMGTRRGLTRGQQRQIDQIEKENMRLRIAETEQQLAIGNIQQTGLMTSQDKLDALKRSHDQTIYAQELKDLGKHIDDVYTLWSNMYKQLAREQQALAQNTVTRGTVSGSASGRIGLSGTATATTSSSSNLVAELLRKAMSQGHIDPLTGLSNYRMR